MYSDTSALILAGGQGQRVAGKDKGLLEYQGQLLIEYALSTLKPYYQEIIISANRNLNDYQKYGYPVITDKAYQEQQLFKGPLAGIAAGMQEVSTPYLLVYACDLVNIPEGLISQLEQHKSDADIIVASHTKKPQYLLSIWRTSLLNSINLALANNHLAVYRFLQKHQTTFIEFADADWINLNDNRFFS